MTKSSCISHFRFCRSIVELTPVHSPALHKATPSVPFFNHAWILPHVDSQLYYEMVHFGISPRNYSLRSIVVNSFVVCANSTSHRDRWLAFIRHKLAPRHHHDEPVQTPLLWIQLHPHNNVRPYGWWLHESGEWYDRAFALRSLPLTFRYVTITLTMRSLPNRLFRFTTGGP